MLGSQIAEAEEYKRCRQVEQALTKGQLKVLRAFAEGKTPKEVAGSLVISPSTVSTHLTSIFHQYRIAWNLPESYSLDYHFLREKFARYFHQDE
ncbi:MAG TPA: helix-turn-helix transcriptional regulator [Ktedonobacteraceae bacterium]|nr:helix-turn-helix transcriptional regulator [Ktedonobacteraceae bacterium]